VLSGQPKQSPRVQDGDAKLEFLIAKLSPIGDKFGVDIDKDDIFNRRVRKLGAHNWCLWRMT
jgi:hypothetical protein